MANENLKDRWTELANQFSSDEELVQRLYRDIEARYGEPHRHYHTLAHVESLIADLDGPTKSLNSDDQAAVYFALWFHDVIYQPGAKDNERRSARYADSALRELGVGDGVRNRACYMIDCTASHTNPKNDFPTQLFIDADMAILGSSGNTYDRYVANIQREFSGIPVAIYRAGRKRFLESLLAQNTIFGTETFRSRCEAAARANIARELSGAC